MRSTISLLLPLLATVYVSAHGRIGTLHVGGKSFPGNTPGGKTSPSVIRQVNTVSPVNDFNSNDLICGPGAKSGTLVADANPGDELKFDWKSGTGGNWPHDTGPMLTYMASCGSTTCDKFDAKTAKWFKISQDGRKQSAKGWVQADVFNGKAAVSRVPANLAPGNYLVRHEIIGLHLVGGGGTPEFYPSCSQLRVGGKETGVPKKSDLVSFPGAYKRDDAGLKPNSKIYDPNFVYTFPGPPIAALVKSGNAQPAADTKSEASTRASDTTAKSPAKTAKCKQRENKREVNTTRHVSSRIMRRDRFEGFF